MPKNFAVRRSRPRARPPSGGAVLEGLEVILEVVGVEVVADHAGAEHVVVVDELAAGDDFDAAEEEVGGVLLR